MAKDVDTPVQKKEVEAADLPRPPEPDPFDVTFLDAWPAEKIQKQIWIMQELGQTDAKARFLPEHAASVLAERNM